MTEYTLDDQWRSFQTFVATYLAGMRHPRDVFTISRSSAVAPPLAEFRCDGPSRLWFGIGAPSWSDADGAALPFPPEAADQIAGQLVPMLREHAQVADPADLRLSGSGPASAVSVLAGAGFMSGDDTDAARQAAQRARMSADVDRAGDVIDAAARAAGQRAFAETSNASIAAIAFAAALADLRSWVDPFTPTPQTGYLVGNDAAATDD